MPTVSEFRQAYIDALASEFQTNKKGYSTDAKHAVTPLNYEMAYARAVWLADKMLPAYRDGKAQNPRSSPVMASVLRKYKLPVSIKSLATLLNREEI